RFLPQLHSFPARRSSDLVENPPPRWCEAQVSCEELHHSCRVADRRAPGAVLFTIAERAQYIISNSDQIIIGSRPRPRHGNRENPDRKSTRLNSSHVNISY